MAHFVKLDDNNIVIESYVISNDSCLDGDGNESEAVGVSFCEGLFGVGTYKQTSYNTYANKHFDADGNEDSGTPFRKNYASIGFTYDSSNNGFHEAQPFASWTLDTNSMLWVAPLELPSDNNKYYWDESAYQADNTTGWVSE
jgi:hypothetical protein